MRNTQETVELLTKHSEVSHLWNVQHNDECALSYALLQEGVSDENIQNHIEMISLLADRPEVSQAELSEKLRSFSDSELLFACDYCLDHNIARDSARYHSN